MIAAALCRTSPRIVWSRQLFVLLLFLTALLSTGTLHGKPIQIITAPEVKNMIENDPHVVVINALSRIEYDGLHITGSINIPIIDFQKSKLLPTDKATPLIIYCMGHD
ncbi:MAG: rhodanese-like domain-containing protein [Thermodesulfobacteriota bacterium]